MFGLCPAVDAWVTAPCRCTTAGSSSEVSTYQPGAPAPYPALPDQSLLSVIGVTATPAPDTGAAYAVPPPNTTAAAAAASPAAMHRRDCMMFRIVSSCPRGG